VTEPSSGAPVASGPPNPAGLLRGLTSEQVDAVTYGEGPQEILAAPGSGKTRVLTTRVEWLLTAPDPRRPAGPLASPEEIVVVTFTNNAASECATRIQDRLGPDALTGMVICTFHSLCSRILRQHAPAIGRQDNFTIYDQREVRTVVDYVLGDKNRAAVLREVERFGACSPVEVHHEISLAKNRLWTPDFYQEHSAHPIAPLIVAVWRELDRELVESNAVDFDDLQCSCVDLLNRHPDLLERLRAKWPHVLVDEVQDTNYVQMGLLVLLQAPYGNVTIVGDLNQRCYGWRGAELNNIATFSEQFPGHRTIALGRNFRSKEEIVLAAARLIARNTRGPKIEHVSDRGPGGCVEAHRFDNEWAEAAWIAGEVTRRLRAGATADQVLVMARTSFATQAVQRALAQANIKHRVLGSLGLYERGEIKDALAYLWLVVNPNDTVSFRRALGVPRRGAGVATVEAIVRYARANQLDLLTACTHVDRIPRIRAQARDNIVRFSNAMLAVRGEHAAGRSLGHIVAATLMLEGGLVQHHQQRSRTAKRKDDRHDADRVVEDLRSVWRAASVYEEQEGALGTLLGFLEQAVGLHSQELEGREPVVTVSTVHKAKGMGKRLVFICGCEQRLFPTWRALETGALLALEEERCLFYVAITRGEDEVHFTWCTNRNGHATDGVSQFVIEAGVSPT
jgi:DNA helicase II / ATP-dependent DNA helicase PcrA